ncbi:MAG: amidase [Dehalococcoidia bacterium]|nr:amidase [Dehalococcoidia bacterium]MSQ36574.1 amidase [Dehalococcoidia bacterium]
MWAVAVVRTQARRAASALVLAAAAVACGGDDEDAGAAAPAGTATPRTAAAGTTTATAASGGGQVSIASRSFGAPARVKAGTRVTWTNRDEVPHTVTANDGSFKSGNIAPGATFSQEFARAGTFAYKCSIHAEMAGSVIVE